MFGNKIRIQQFFVPVKTQLNKTNDAREDAIKNIPQSQTKKADSSKPYH